MLSNKVADVLCGRLKNKCSGAITPDAIQEMKGYPRAGGSVMLLEEYASMILLSMIYASGMEVV